jgi:hypothetical protein
VEHPLEMDAEAMRVLADVLPYGAGTDHPGYFAFIPSFTTWPAALAELTAAPANLYCGAWLESAGAAQVELEVLDWGGGYGYTRLATVRCAEPGRLLRLTGEDFQWLADTEPDVRARLAAVQAERLKQR